MNADEGRKRLGEAVTAARLRAGMGKEAAARRAQISSITLSRIEDGLAVQDVKLAAIERALADEAVWVVGDAARLRAGVEPALPSSSEARERPVGLGLDDAAEGLAPEQVERIRALILDIKGGT